jgi:hypothetical protein
MHEFAVGSARTAQPGKIGAGGDAGLVDLLPFHFQGFYPIGFAIQITHSHDSAWAM